MKCVQGFWLPDQDTHLSDFLDRGPSFAGGPTYQFKKFAAAFPLIKDFRHAVDVGAHCGLWTRVLAQCFGKVTAFEPLDEHFACLTRNVTTGNVQMYKVAMGEKSGAVALDLDADNTGLARISSEGRIPAVMRTLDSYGLEPVDFLKVDCEGFEYFVLAGGAKTILRDRPTIIVEQNREHADRFGLAPLKAVDLLQSWGAEVAFRQRGDYCLHWPDAPKKKPRNRWSALRSKIRDAISPGTVDPGLATALMRKDQHERQLDSRDLER